MPPSLGKFSLSLAIVVVGMALVVSRDVSAQQKQRYDDATKVAIVNAFTKLLAENGHKDESEALKKAKWTQIDDSPSYSLGSNWLVNSETSQFTWMRLRDAQGRPYLSNAGKLSFAKNGSAVATFTKTDITTKYKD